MFGVDTAASIHDSSPAVVVQRNARRYARAPGASSTGRLGHGIRLMPAPCPRAARIGYRPVMAELPDVTIYVGHLVWLLAGSRHDRRSTSPARTPQSHGEPLPTPDTELLT